MPAFATIFLCFGLQSLLSNTPISAAPTFGSISFPNMLAVNASASASASASAQVSANLTGDWGAGGHPNATTAGTSMGDSGALTMPGLTPSKTCVCEAGASSPLPSAGVPGTVSPDATPAVTSGPDASAPSPSPSAEPSTDSEPPSELKSTSPDAPADTQSYPTAGPDGSAVSAAGSANDTAPTGSTNASSPPAPETPGVASGLVISDCARALPVLTSIVAGLAFLYA